MIGPDESRARLRSVIAAAAVVVALALVPAIAGLLFGAFGWRQFRNWATSGLVYSGLIVTMCWSLAPQLLRRIKARPPWMQIAALAALFVIAGVFGAIAGNLILRSIGLGDRFWFAIRISLAVTLSFGLLCYALTALSDRLRVVKQELGRQQIAEERARKMAAEARYASLESRVQPHFLFNTLNSISALVRENPAEAERMIERLSALLRYSLDSDIAGLVPLSEELRIIEEYLQIEQVRFGPRLRYRIEVEAAAHTLRVPALSIQTLVENSVKYAVGAARAGATITIGARFRDGALRVEVSDDGPGFEPEHHFKPGHGLDLVRRRLDTLFGPAASLEIGARDGVTCVAISVPS
jgi:sensor histidine kinase YesM